MMIVIIGLIMSKIVFIDTKINTNTHDGKTNIRVEVHTSFHTEPKIKNIRNIHIDHVCCYAY